MWSKSPFFPILSSLLRDRFAIHFFILLLVFVLVSPRHVRRPGIGERVYKAPSPEIRPTYKSNFVHCRIWWYDVYFRPMYVYINKAYLFLLLSLLMLSFYFLVSFSRTIFLLCHEIECPSLLLLYSCYYFCFYIFLYWGVDHYSLFVNVMATALYGWCATACTVERRTAVYTDTLHAHKQPPTKDLMNS